MCTPSPLIRCQQLCKTYQMGDNLLQALRGISLDIYAGEYVAVMGASGSGKSTFMNLLGALDKPSSGELEIDGRNIGSLSSDELAYFRNEVIGFVFQQFNLLARTSALENVELPMLYSRKARPNRHERAKQCLELVGLGQRMDHQPSQLSGGQQQRVAIARALVNEPRILLADEPTGALDTKTSEEVMAIFGQLNQMGITVILVTHEPDIADHAKRRLMFRDGLLLEDKHA
ncbi:ABC transporter ATP-binding protein [Beggiatoa leptomitoformis]|uniref:ATP-binding cassette domain-containing protein n=1 Tax=Beggiatoa leptomitoformis TaxID=288004 RepID=A0A2N9YCC7_9GAMM|nr:ABC transporter ATP-binding protein [Beggiatoa leptomitoformis]ALG66599.1 ATP-binding cassette domain-containing protein [Beggiatoa leptomitoformis]AUI68092.1 ATP-binding cassette domain-containing protein [Beggiatoa leptomitoformis]